MWTYATGLSDDYHYPWNNCPCAAKPGHNAPVFVGHNYYCESGYAGTADNEYYTADILWDRYGCHHANNNCCTNPYMPWLFRQFSHSMNDYLEARTCNNQPFSNEHTLMESIELYIQ